MTMEELYDRIGGNYQSLLQRIPSAAMIRKFVGKYPQDPTYAQLCSAVDLNFDRLYQVSLALTEALRGREPLTDYSLLDAVSAEHTTLIDAISQLDN